MNLKMLREPSAWLCAIASALVAAAVSLLFDKYIKPLPIFFDTDAQTWVEEKLGLSIAFSLVGIWLFRKLRTLFFASERIVG